ncbi:MAG TPA: hypothetical protein P5064_02155 [Clostridia bacterium]|jgi:hypothetical protein|nr:hypothetical protein [Clostridiaceae bacterium]HOF26260.1 hypothetical protein [Clostridia bacterium]HOM35038.1 hypothetical protein [Clostridia bacterium]HOR89564.1 hypothetical protein [Clostridia bacterium]HOT70030.1 hypothetical protein [Clostridia bacterium]
MKRKTVMLIAVILAIVFVTGLASCTPHEIRISPSINTANALEDKYIVVEAEYNVATYGGEPIMKPTVAQFNNISRQKTLNARLNAFNEMVGRDSGQDRNEQLYQSYEIRQINRYLFSCEYFTGFETTVTNKGVNMLVGSEINGTLLMNFPALLGTKQESDSWTEFMVLFEEARKAAGAKEITKEYMATDNVSYVFDGDDLTDLTLRILYKAPDDTKQQEVPMKLNDIKGCFLEKIQIFMSFTEDPLMDYEEYANTILEYVLQQE